MRTPRSIQVILAVAFTTLTGCATSSDYRQVEHTPGLFDEEESYSGGDGGYAAAPSPPSDPMREISLKSIGGASARRAEAKPGPARPRDATIDFSDVEIGGELTKPQGAQAEPPLAEPPATDAKPPEASGPRLVIYTGSMTVLVSANEPAVEKFSARAKELGGYVESQSGNAGANNATLTVRVPAEKFYDVVGELASYGQVTQKQINASDVTKKVFDIELRLETAEKSRQRLLDLLKSATKMEEILQIEAQVRRLTDEIEGMKGELRFLKDQVAFSTLTVTFWSNAPPPAAGPTRMRSRFEWINQVGVENVLQGF